MDKPKLKGVRQFTIDLNGSDKVMIYSNVTEIILQLRRLTHGAEDPMAVSFKCSVVLTAAEAAKLAAELLTVAAVAARTPPG